MVLSGSVRCVDFPGKFVRATVGIAAKVLANALISSRDVKFVTVFYSSGGTNEVDKIIGPAIKPSKVSFSTF